MAKRKGKLIVIDGTDGVAKTTQANLLCERLKKDGHTVQTMHFPHHNNFLGRFIDQCLMGTYGNFLSIDPRIVSVLYAADRFESKKKLEQWLKSGATVVLDRYVSANQIHQGSKIRQLQERKKFLHWLDKLEYGVFGLPRPDAVIYLHLSIPLSLKLLSKKPNKDLAEKNLQHQKDAEATALWLAQTQRGWHKIICYDKKSMLPRGIIHEKVYSAIGL